VLAAISTPLKFLGLIVLVVEGILGTLAFRVTGADLTILLVGMLVCLMALILTGVWFVKQSTPPALSPASQVQMPVTDVLPTNFRYDVFLSSPMAGHDNETEYKRSREQAITFAASLRAKCHFTSIYYAGNDIANMEDFEAADISAEDVLDAVRQSKFFILIYQSKIVSSTLLETGCALALRKPSVYFVRSRDDLPFLMRKAEQAFPNIVKIYECEDMAAILKLLEKHADRLFPSAKH
jgi:hypothetical protein